MILVTGGCGYIGSHTCVELLGAGHDIVILDNLSNSRAEVIDAITRISCKTPTLVQGDIRDAALLDRLFAQYNFSAVLHFAGLKSPAESMLEPARYYENNVQGSLTLFEAMERHAIYQVVFSSTAAVYGDQPVLPVREDSPLNPPHPYGRSKLMVEQILRDLATANPQWCGSILRYFNPVGAHDSGLIGESPQGIPNNLVPYIAQVASGQREYLSVFGNDYPTPDGTGIRDFIHVVDLARGHLQALQYLQSNPGVHVHNLGTGRGYSVLEMLAAFERAVGKPIAHRIVARRSGDIAISYADVAKAQRELGWTASHDLDAMCRDAWHWSNNMPPP